MLRPLILGAATLVAAAVSFGPAAPPALAQSYTTPTITVFGTDPCPRDTICIRASENERYRIPKELRGDTGLALAERWGDRVKSIEYAGASGIQSCSPVGAGGASGCFNQMARQAKQERRDKGEEPTVPLQLP